MSRLVLFLALLSTPLFAAPSPTAGLLESSTFNAAGTAAETLMHVPRLGRYALISQASLGARLELVDRMAGTLATAGNASGVQASSGRIDAFLEPGEYKLRVSKPADGTVSVAAQQYTTANAGKDDLDVPVLYGRQTFTGELHDLQLLSWWVRIDASDPTLLVAMEGRSLADAALWKDGAWDTGLRPLARKYEIEPGSPLTTLEYNTRLDPGMYLLVCVGGPRNTWARASDSDLFTITRGGRYLGSTGVTSVTFGAPGLESFLVSGSAGYFQVEAANNKGYLLAVSSNTAGASRFDYRRTAKIDAKSTSYRASISGGAGGSTQWVTLQGPPGETVEVRWFPVLTGSGREATTTGLDPGRSGTTYMASVLGGADGEESIDLTGLVVTSTGAGSSFRASASNMQTVTIGSGAPLHRRINLLSPLSFLLQVNDAGSYAIMENVGSATARYSFLLLDDWLTRARGVAAVEVKGAGSITLQAKLYVVTVQPGQAASAGAGAGILDFAFAPAGGGDATALFGSPPAATANGLFWPGLTAVPGAGTALIVGTRGPVPVGMALRALPVDLSEPVFVRVDPGESVSFAFKNDAEGRVFSTNPSFTSKAVMVDNTAWTEDRDIAPGQHQLLVYNLADTAQWYVIGMVRSTAVATFEVTRAPDNALPTFTEGAPLWRDFGRGELATYMLQVAQPASYRIATAGRLTLSVTIRTALRTSLFSASANADGRNAVITSYLRPGTYLVQVRTQGSSQGRAGMLLQRMPVMEAGVLTDGAVLRNTVQAGTLLATGVRIDAADDYRLECLGLGRSFAYRFEDADGWPIGQPIGSGVLTTRLAPGTYRYIAAADEVQTRRLLALAAAPSATRTPDDPKAKLLAIEPNRTYAKTWVEAEGRPQDVFTFSVPAQVHVLLYLSQGMQYSVADARGVVALSGTGGELGEADLPQGAWRISVNAMERDNLKAYKLLLATSDLYDGSVRPLGAPPQSFPLAVGTAGTVELWSYGSQEMEALLLDSADRTVALSETIPDDWNFRVVANLVPGRYRIVLVAPGAAQAARLTSAASAAQATAPAQAPAAAGSAVTKRPTFTNVPTMTPPGPGSAVMRVVSRPGITLPASSGTLAATLDVAAEVVFAAFTPKTAGLYRFDGSSDDPLSVSVSRKGTVEATGTCPVFLPLAAGVSYDVRFWHAGATKQKTVLRVGQEKAAELALGGAETAVDVKESALRVSVTAAAGFSVFPDAADGVLYSAGADLALRPIADESVGTAAGAGWLVRADGSPLGRMKVTPLVLGADSARAFRVGAVPQSFAVTVPPKTAAVIRTDNAGRFVGLSAAAAAAFRPDLFDWRASSVTPLTTAAGLRDGAFRGKLWDAAAQGDLPDGRAGVSASFYPVASETPLALGQRTQVSVDPQSAVSFTLAASPQSVKVSLQAGMAAFATAAGAPRGFLDAQDDSLTGLLDATGRTVTVVNEGRLPGLCTVESMVPQAQALLTESAAFESSMVQKALTFPVAADKGSRIYLWAAQPGALAGRFLREEDGRIYTGETSATDFGPVVSFPAGRGVLQVTADGALRIWAAKPEAMRTAFVGRTTASRTTALGAAGAALGQAAEAWTFSVPADAVVSLGAATGGVTAVYNRAGGLAGVAAGDTARTLLASLAAGTYTAFTRPLSGGGQAGILRLQTLRPETLAAEGEGAAVLIGPGEKKLYHFDVKAEGKVGAGIRTDRDDLLATLFDKAFRRVDAGSIFIRSLPIGGYYLLVESAEGATVKFSPLVYGLDGSRTATPDDIIKSYSRE